MESFYKMLSLKRKQQSAINFPAIHEYWDRAVKTIIEYNHLSLFNSKKEGQNVLYLRRDVFF